MKSSCVTSLAFLCLAAAPAFARQKAAAEGAAAVSPHDRTFATKAAAGGLLEVDLGNLAKDKASNAAVKSFGQRMVDDHTKFNDDMKKWASDNNVTLPSSLDAKGQREHNRLSALSGDAFDRAYIHLMVRDHREDIREFEREASTAHNAALKDLANSALPTLRSHLQDAEKAASEVGVKAGPGMAGHGKHAKEKTEEKTEKP